MQVPGAAAVEVPAGQSLPLAVAGSGLAAEAVVALRVPASSSGGGGSLAEPGQKLQPRGQVLRSQPFSLDCSEDGAAGGSSGAGVHLLLRPEAQPALARNGSRGFWGGSSSGAADGSGSQAEPVECRLAARVEARSYVAAGGTAAEAISVTVTAGCFVSNLTGLPLAMLTEGAAAGEALTTAGSGGSDQAPAQQQQQQALLPPTATVPLMHVWRSGEDGSKQARHQRQRSWSSGDMLRTFSGGLLPSPASSQPAQPATAAGPVGPALRFALAAPLDPTEGDLPTPRSMLHQWSSSPAGAASQAAQLGDWSSRLRPYDTAGRQRLYLQQPRGAADSSSSSPGAESGSGGLVMLTYRVLLSGGCFHLVLFRWAGAGCRRASSQRYGPSDDMLRDSA